MKSLLILKRFWSVKDMKIRNHPAFADDTQNKIDYIDELVSVYHKYKELEKFGEIELCREFRRGIQIFRGIEALAAALQASYFSTPVKYANFSFLETSFTYKGVKFFQIRESADI